MSCFVVVAVRLHPSSTVPARSPFLQSPSATMTAMRGVTNTPAVEIPASAVNVFNFSATPSTPSYYQGRCPHFHVMHVILLRCVVLVVRLAVCTQQLCMDILWLKSTVL